MCNVTVPEVVKLEAAPREWIAARRAIIDGGLALEVPGYPPVMIEWPAGEESRVLAVVEAAERLYATEREVAATNDAEPFDVDAWEVAHQAYQDSYSDLRAAVAALDDRR